MTDGWLPKRPSEPRWPDDQARQMAAQFDPRNLPAGFAENPYPYYDALRRFAPVHECPDGSYFLTAYADILAVYRDTVAFSSDKKKEFGPKYGDTPLFEHHTTSLVFNDPPLHTRVRKLIVGAMTPRAIMRTEEALVSLVDRLIESIAAQGGGDLIDDFAAAIPVEVIGNLLDIPTEERAPLREWSLAILGALEPVLSAEQEARGNQAVSEFSDYLRDLISCRRVSPGDPATDVLTRLINGEAGGEQLTETELIQNCIFILNAGHETTTNLIGNGLYALMEWPDERSHLAAAPDLISLAVEEFLRFESSNQLGNRITTQPAMVGNTQLSPVTPVTLCIGAANRDPAVFEKPGCLDVSRSPNKHLAFGGGAHTCAGLSLARLEGTIAIGRLIARFPNYALAGEPKRSGRVRFRGFLSMPVVLS